MEVHSFVPLFFSFLVLFVVWLSLAVCLLILRFATLFKRFTTFPTSWKDSFLKEYVLADIFGYLSQATR
jgi:hypothetical protein